MRVPKGVTSRLPFPKEVMVELPYVSTINFSIGAALDTYFWRGNGAYDPDYSSTGHQPFGFDQWTAFYDRYTVVSSKAELKVISGGTPTPCAIALVPARTTTDYAMVGEAIESPHAKFGILDDNNPIPVQLTKSMSSHIILGTTRQKILDDDVYSGGTGADPTHPWYWAVCGGTYSGNLDVYLVMKITYRIRFYEPIQLSQS
jgi:hypothetical protein